MDSLQSIVKLALLEDIGNGDLTAALVPEKNQAHARVICREPAILAGKRWFDEVFRQVDERVEIYWHFKDSEQLETNTVICEIKGPARSILTAERTALNFLQTLSATASITRRYVAAVAGTGTIILDTRKTIPGLRDAQKYAVTCGGGKNHRHGLYDAILLKENHILAAGGIANAIFKANVPEGILVEVEVETLDELAEAIEAGAHRALLDNMTPDQMRQAVDLTAGRIELEASGNITLDNIREIAETGINYISIGAITKHIHAVDLSMRFVE